MAQSRQPSCRMLTRGRDPLTTVVCGQRILDTPVIRLGLDLPITPNATLRATRQAPQNNTHSRAVLDHVRSGIACDALPDHADHHSLTV